MSELSETIIAMNEEIQDKIRSRVHIDPMDLPTKLTVINKHDVLSTVIAYDRQYHKQLLKARTDVFKEELDEIHRKYGFEKVKDAKGIEKVKSNGT